MYPFSEDRDETVAAWGERRLLEAMREWLGRACPPSPRGMGDDAALVPAGANLLTNDCLIHGRHFDDDCLPSDAAAKLVKRGLSDIAAMGGTPQQSVVALLLPGQTRLDWLEAFARAMAATALRYGLELNGGDITETSGVLGGCITVTGTAERPLLRSGARAGDTLWVTGELGASRHGHHLYFHPRLDEGRWLAERPDVRACLDLTDGLAKDLPELLPRGSAAALEVRNFPLRSGPSGPVDWRRAMTDGEDYELLFALDAASNRDAFEREWECAFGTRLTCLGGIIARDGGGHFRDAQSGEELHVDGGYEHLR